LVTIVDRTGEQQEIRFDNRIWSFGKKTTQVLPLEVASWLFRNGDKHLIHTTDGDFVRRYGVVDAPEDWVEEMGADVLETSPLTRDTTRAEGWDAESVRTGPVKLVDLTTTEHRPRRGDYVNQGTAGGR
jgi:hypothetical protein